jgi:hypothetical protein
MTPSESLRAAAAAAQANLDSMAGKVLNLKSFTGSAAAGAPPPAGAPP